MSCLFQSLAALLQSDHRTLRQDICDYLARNPSLLDDDTQTNDILRWESGLEPKEYIQRMRSYDTWGGAIEIRAFANMSGYKVLVHVARSSKIIEFLPSRDVPTRGELHIKWTGNHFDPLRSFPN